MQKDLIYRYGKFFENDKVVLDNYSLDAGIYIRIDRSGNIVKLLEVDKNSYEDLRGNDEYNWFKDRDFYSNRLDSYKYISAGVQGYSTMKKIESNNYLTIFFKSTLLKELYEGEKEALPSDIFKKMIEQYYKSLQELENKDKNVLKVPDISMEILNKCKNIYLTNFEKIVFALKEKNVKKGTTIKLFIEDSFENYKKSSLKYYALKIFNCSDYNQFFDNELYGANNYNFGMNSKKPYMELKTTTYKVPCRITLNEIKKIRNMYVWLKKNMWLYRDELISTKFKFNGDFRKEELNEIFLLNNIIVKGSLVIKNFEYIPNYTNNIKEIVFKNYINNLKLKDFEQKIIKLKNLERFISKNWFDGCLEKGYHDYKSVASLKTDSIYKGFILQYSKIFYEFFYKLDDKPLKQKLDEIGINITEKILLNEFTKEDFTKYKKLYNATRSLNIYLVLNEYFKGNGGNDVENLIDRLKENMRTVLNADAHIETEEDFYFALGQISYYLIRHSKAEKLTQDVFEPILNAGNIEAAKEELEFLYRRYKHEIGINNISFKKILSELLAYEPKKKLKNNNTILLIGLLTDNVFYEKKGEIINE